MQHEIDFVMNRNFIISDDRNGELYAAGFIDRADSYCVKPKTMLLIKLRRRHVVVRRRNYQPISAGAAHLLNQSGKQKAVPMPTPWRTA